MRETTTLERKTETDARAERILAGALKGRGGALTKADAIALTGLSTLETDAALKSLLVRYRSHLDVTEKGELIYRFDPSMVRRDAPTLAERLREVGQALWKAFTFLFKIWIVFTLVFYFVAFVAMMIALIFARSSSDRDDRRSSNGDGFGFPWILWWMMPDWAPPEVQRRQKRRRPQKRFYQSVFDFVFGPPQAGADPLTAERQVVGYLRSVDGRITATDLVALTGWSYDRAEEEATRLLAAYDGEPEITEEGTLVYSFPSLRATAAETPRGAAGDGGWRYAWNQPRQLAPLSGNPSGTNAVIGLLNGFNLMSALVVGPAFLARYGIESGGADLLVTWFPLAFSSLFFAVPGARALRRSRAEKRLLAEGMRARLIGEIVARRGSPARPEELIQAAVRRGGGSPDGAPAEKILDRLLVDLDGDVTTDDEGRTLYRFPRIAEELQAAESARQLAPAAERDAGQVVFSSEGEDETPAIGPGAGQPALPPRGRLH